MLKMASSALASEFPSELDGFLYASIDEGGGRLLSVLSMLARLDLDPWQEAASLARMPRENATQRLAVLIAALPDRPSTRQDSNAVASRLIKLLPHGDSSNSALREVLPGFDALSNLRAFVYVVILNLLFLAIAFGTQYLSATDQSPAQPGHAHLSVANGATPKAPPLTK
jgi:hypothetical protein